MAHLQEILTKLEPVFLLLVLVAFFRSGSARRFPAIATYLIMRVSSVLFLDCFLLGGALPRCGTVRYTVYFYGYWVSYVACAITIFFVLQEVFKRVMEPVPGLRRLGLLAFRWVSVVSTVVSVGAIAVPAAAASNSGGPLEIIALHTVRCVSVMELCLLAFLVLTINTLGRSFRSRVFGIGLGFGLQAAAELICCALVAKYPTMSSPANLFLEISTLTVYLVWVLYFAVPEPVAERKLIVLPPNSMMARWNALANGIGQTPEPSVAPATGFFLQDIENVVDRVLAKNPVIANR